MAISWKARLKEHFEKNDSWVKIVAIYLFLLLCCFMTIYPISFIFTVSLRPGNQLFSTSLKLIPDNATFQNYINAFTKYPMARWMLNSLLVATVTAIFAVIISVNAGYAFSRYRFFGRKFGMTLLLVTQMFPAPMLLLPVYLMLAKLKLTNSYIGLILWYVSTAVPFNIWLMKGYFDTIPKSLEESAFIDGASVLRTYWSIILPLAKPAVALCALFAFMGAWSEFIVARILIQSKSMLTLPVGLIALQGSFSTEWGTYSAAALVTAIPVTVLFISLSKYLVGGLTLGSVKG